MVTDMKNNCIPNSYYEIHLSPKCGPCHNFADNGFYTTRTAWLVPHVVKNKDGSQIITWRCNWGGICKSECIYAMLKERERPPEKSTSIPAFI